MKTKSSLRMEIKEIAEEGTFEGLLSPYGSVDRGFDVVEPGAYTKTLKERGSKVPLLWSHKQDVPIGFLDLEDRPEGLWCAGKLLLDMQTAKEAYAWIKSSISEGIPPGLSIGYQSIKDSVEKGVRHLKEIKLFEGSVVVFPMHPLARILQAKANGDTDRKGDFDQEFTEANILASFDLAISSVRQAYISTIWSDMSREEKVGMGTTIAQQFAAEMSTLFPAYLDALAEVYGLKEDWADKRRELKAGAEFSGASIDNIKGICKKLLDAHSYLSALVESKAGPSTSPTSAAETKAEPDEDHSAVAAGIGEMLAKFNAAIPK